MKFRNGIWTILLVLALMITCTTVKTFAEGEKGGATDSPKPISLSYSGQTLTYHDGEDYVSGFYVEGNQITVHYDDGSTRTYIYKEFYDDDDDFIAEGYYLNGKVPLDEYGDPDYYKYEYFDVAIPEGGIPAGTTRLEFFYYTFYEDEELIVYGQVEAEKEAELERIEYEGAPIYYYEPLYDFDEIIIDNHFIPGNKITFYYDNGATEEYIYTEYTTYDEEGDPWEDGSYVLDGVVVFNEYGYADNSIDPYFDYTEGEDTIRIYPALYITDIYVDVPIKVAPKPVAAVYDGCSVHYSPGGEGLEGLREENNKIIISYDDGSSREYICKRYFEDGYPMYDYFLDGDTEKESMGPIEFETDYVPAGTREITFYIDMWYGDESIYVSCTLPVSPAPAPASIEFIPGNEDFVVEGLIGKTIVDERAFEGEGNKFVVTYVDGNTKEYIWLPDTKENTGGFKLNGNYYETNFAIGTELKDGVQKGTHDITFKYGEYVEIDGETEEVTVSFTTPVTATKQFTYVVLDTTKTQYTGKVIKPVAKLYRYDGKLLATKIYTVSYPKAVKVGCYEVKPTITATFAGVYGTDDDSSADFSIVPRKEAISKVTAGKRSFTVSWSKFSWQQATGYQVQYALNSKFTKSKKTVTVTSYKTAKKTIKKLKGKKKYYVRVRAYKVVNGERLYGSWSKAKYVTTKW